MTKKNNFAEFYYFKKKIGIIKCKSSQYSQENTKGIFTFPFSKTKVTKFEISQKLANLTF